MGCDKAIIVNDPALDGADEAAIATVLAAVLKREAYDLILFGIKAIDDDSGQVGIMVAEKLGLPHVSTITKLELGDGTLTAHREIEGGKEIVDASLPAVLTCQKGLNEPRLPSLPNIMKAGMKPMETVTCADLGIDAAGQPGRGQALLPAAGARRLQAGRGRRSGRRRPGTGPPAARGSQGHLTAGTRPTGESTCRTLPYSSSSGTAPSRRSPGR